MTEPQPYAELRERLLSAARLTELTSPAVSHNLAEAAEAISTLLDRLSALEGALEPFAKVADAFDYWSAEAMPEFSYPVQTCDVKFALEDCPNAIGELSANDFYAARTTLSREGRKEGGANAG